MKKVLSWLAVVGLLTVVGLTAGAARAVYRQQTQFFRLGDHLFVAGNSVTITEDVAGDLYVAGNDIEINGSIGGDLFFGGNTVTVNGNVAGAVRGGGQFVNLNGSVGGLTLVGGMTVKLNAGNAATAADAILGGQRVTVNRALKGDAVLGAQALTLNQPVAGDLTVGVSQLDAGDQVTVGGDTTYYADDENPAITKTLEDVTTGTVAFRQLSDYNLVYLARWNLSAVNFLTVLYKTFTIIFFGLLVARLWPRSVASLVEVQRARPWLVAGLGVIALPVAGVIGLALLVSVVFAGLAGILAVTAIPLMFLGTAAVYQNVGQALTARSGERRGWAMVAGGLAFVILYLIPVVNLLTLLVLLLFAAGSLTDVLLRRLKLNI